MPYFIDFKCGEVLLNTTGTFGYKSRDNGYAPFLINCTWVIMAESYQLIDLTMIYLDLHQNNSCEFTSLQVRYLMNINFKQIRFRIKYTLKSIFNHNNCILQIHVSN